MKIGLSFLPQIRSLLIQTPDPAQLAEMDVDVRAAKTGGGWIAQQISELVAQISGSFGREHNDNDTHSTITATGSISERGRTIPMGEWIPVPYNAGDFTAITGTWTVDAADVLLFAYMLLGKTLFVTFNLQTTSVSATPTSLYLKIPGNFLAKTQMWGLVSVLDNTGTYEAGVAYVGVNNILNQISLQRQSYGSTNWSTAVNATSIRGTIAFEIV